MVREEIKKLIKKAIKELGFEIPEVLIEEPKEKSHGDYSTNAAMAIGRQIGKSPMEIANLVNSKLKIKNLKFLDEVEVVKPGFINFFLSKEYLQKEVGEILKEKRKFGNLKLGKNKKIQVEFISANPTGPLTIGNARGGPFGDVLANIFKKAGFRVERAYYINDFGNQILVLGHSVLKDEKAEYKGDYIEELNKRIKEKNPYKAGERAAEIIIKEMIKKTVAKMGIKFDEWFSEKKLHKSGADDKIIELLKKKDLVYEEEGALWFKAKNFGDNRDRVLVKTDEAKTYLAGDIAYHRYKFEKKKFDKVINIWGADHYGDIAGLQAGIEAMGFKNKIDFVLLQFITLLEKGEKIKMSKRKGVYLTMNQLLDEIPLDVIRFFFLQKSADTHLNFDMDLAKKQSTENPVYYVQYAYARICSILRKVRNYSLPVTNYKLLNHPSELDLIKQLIRLPEIIEDTVKDYQVQRLPQHAIDLADAFHKFYENCRVITDDKELTQARLALVLVTKIVLKNVLDLMGISSPEKM